MTPEETNGFDEESQMPDWHREELARTEERLAKGKEQVVDWEIAKKELRKAFES